MCSSRSLSRSAILQLHCSSAWFQCLWIFLDRNENTPTNFTDYGDTNWLKTSPEIKSLRAGPSGYIHVTWCHISLDSIRSQPSGKNILKKSGTSRPAHLLIKSTFSPPHWKIPSLFAPHFLLDFIFVFLYQVPYKSLRVCCTCTLTGTLKFNSNALFFCYSLIPYTATGYPLFCVTILFQNMKFGNEATRRQATMFAAQGYGY